MGSNQLANAYLRNAIWTMLLSSLKERVTNAN